MFQCKIPMDEWIALTLVHAYEGRGFFVSVQEVGLLFTSRRRAVSFFCFSLQSSYFSHSLILSPFTASLLSLLLLSLCIGLLYCSAIHQWPTHGNFFFSSYSPFSPLPSALFFCNLYFIFLRSLDLFSY